MLLPPPSVQFVRAVIETCREQVFPREEIVKKFCSAVTVGIGFPDVSTVIFDTPGTVVALTYSTLAPPWVLPAQEQEWLYKYAKGLIGSSGFPELVLDKPLYVSDRMAQLFTDKFQLKEDMQRFDFSCNDGLYVVFLSEDDVVLGVAFVHAWAEQRLLSEDPYFAERIGLLQELVHATTLALDNLLVHQRIENLLSDKRELRERIQRDEEDLRRRLLELTVLYDTSNSLSHSLNYAQIVGVVMDALSQVLQFDICTIFLLDFSPSGEIFSRLTRPLASRFVQSAQTNVVSATVPFVKRTLHVEDVKVSVELVPTAVHHDEGTLMRSFANVPLTFKEDTIGMLNICSSVRNAFSRNEMTFLHTMANQLAANLGRLKILKQLEKSKMDAVIRSMTDGVIMMDDMDCLEIINPAAQHMLQLPHAATEAVLDKLHHMQLLNTYRDASHGRVSVLEKELHYLGRYFSVNIVPVFDGESTRLGTVIVLRDFTELHKINKTNAQRLEVISKVDVIIKSISNLDELLSVLMEFVMTVANAEMGAIQLLRGRNFQTMVHSNFPDKIRRDYKFISGETLSEHSAKTKQICLIENYLHNPKVNHHVKILIDSYLCIPIVIKDQIIGLLNIARRYGTDHAAWSQEDITTLSTITNLSGTAIQNAILYRETLKKQQLDQELKVANEIQTKLLPETIPKLKHAAIGAVSVPAREIGGDYYDFFSLEHGCVGICIADIVGKGVPAGLYMAMLKSILHTHLSGITSPRQALQTVNALLFRDPVIQKFVPLFYAILEPETMVLTYSNAGHEPAVLFRNGEMHVLDTEGFPLGALLDSTYEEKSVTLQLGDTLLFFTDGLIEARNQEGKRFDLSHIQALVMRDEHLSVSSLLDRLYTQLKQFLEPLEPVDDVTVVALRMSGVSSELETVPIRIKKIRVASGKRFVKRIRLETEVIAREMGFSETEIFNIKMAVNEAHANVIEHAYFGSDKGDILFEFRVFEDRLEVIIKDFGPGIGSKTIKGEEHLDELEGSGLGVFLIKTMMDHVVYNRTAKVGTELLLTKYLQKGVAS